MNQPENMTLKGTLESRRRSKKDHSMADALALPGRWTLLLALVLAPWAFATVHHWSQQWMAILLLISVGFWWFDTAMNHRKTQTLPYVVLFVLIGILLGLLQLVPLPQFLADMVLGRQSEIY